MAAATSGIPVAEVKHSEAPVAPRPASVVPSPRAAIASPSPHAIKVESQVSTAPIAQNDALRQAHHRWDTMRHLEQLPASNVLELMIAGSRLQSDGDMDGDQDNSTVLVGLNSSDDHSSSGNISDTRPSSAMRQTFHGPADGNSSSAGTTSVGSTGSSSIDDQNTALVLGKPARAQTQLFTKPKPRVLAPLFPKLGAQSPKHVTPTAVSPIVASPSASLSPVTVPAAAQPAHTGRLQHVLSTAHAADAKTSMMTIKTRPGEPFAPVGAGALLRSAIVSEENLHSMITRSPSDDDKAAPPGRSAINAKITTVTVAPVSSDGPHALHRLGTQNLPNSPSTGELTSIVPNGDRTNKLLPPDRVHSGVEQAVVLAMKDSDDNSDQQAWWRCPRLHWPDMDAIKWPRKVLLRFSDPNLEKAFQDMYYHKYVSAVRRSISYGTAVWALFGINDFIKDSAGERANFTATITIRAVTVLMGLITLFLSFFNTAFFQRHFERLIAVPVFAVGASQIIFGMIENNVLDPTYACFVIFIASITASFFRLRFLASALVNWSLVCLYIILAAATHDSIQVPLADRIFLSAKAQMGITVALLIGGNIIFAVFAHVREKNIRKGFLVSLRLRAEEERSNRLLRRMLPESIIARLKQGADFVFKKHKDVSVLFSNIADFDDLAASMQPQQLVLLLNDLFSAFDALTDDYRVYKVETIGDVYMVSAGAPTGRPDHADVLCELALDMQEIVSLLFPMLAASDQNGDGDHSNNAHIGASSSAAAAHGHNLRIRIGIMSGPVIAGVIGQKYPRYRLMGDTVNTASRMSTAGCSPGTIQVAAATFDRVRAREIALTGADPADAPDMIKSALPGAPAGDPASVGVQDVVSLDPSQYRDVTAGNFVFADKGLCPVKGKGPTRIYMLRYRRELQPSPSEEALVQHINAPMGYPALADDPANVNDGAEPVVVQAVPAAMAAATRTTRNPHAWLQPAGRNSYPDAPLSARTARASPPLHAQQHEPQSPMTAPVQASSGLFNTMRAGKSTRDLSALVRTVTNAHSRSASAQLPAMKLPHRRSLTLGSGLDTKRFSAAQSSIDECERFGVVPSQSEADFGGITASPSLLVVASAAEANDMDTIRGLGDGDNDQDVDTATMAGTASSMEQTLHAAGTVATGLEPARTHSAGHVRFAQSVDDQDTKRSNSDPNRAPRDANRLHVQTVRGISTTGPLVHQDSSSTIPAFPSWAIGSSEPAGTTGTGAAAAAADSRGVNRFGTVRAARDPLFLPTRAPTLAVGQLPPQRSSSGAVVAAGPVTPLARAPTGHVLSALSRVLSNQQQYGRPRSSTQLTPAEFRAGSTSSDAPAPLQRQSTYDHDVVSMMKLNLLRNRSMEASQLSMIPSQKGGAMSQSRDHQPMSPSGGSMSRSPLAGITVERSVSRSSPEVSADPAVGTEFDRMPIGSPISIEAKLPPLSVESPVSGTVRTLSRGTGSNPSPFVFTTAEDASNRLTPKSFMPINPPKSPRSMALPRGSPLLLGAPRRMSVMPSASVAVIKSSDDMDEPSGEGLLYKLDSYAQLVASRAHELTREHSLQRYLDRDQLQQQQQLLQRAVSATLPSGQPDGARRRSVKTLSLAAAAAAQQAQAAGTSEVSASSVSGEDNRSVSEGNSVTGSSAMSTPRDPLVESPRPATVPVTEPAVTSQLLNGHLEPDRMARAVVARPSVIGTTAAARAFTFASMPHSTDSPFTAVPLGKYVALQTPPMSVGDANESNGVDLLRSPIADGTRPPVTAPTVPISSAIAAASSTGVSMAGANTAPVTSAAQHHNHTGSVSVQSGASNSSQQALMLARFTDGRSDSPQITSPAPNNGSAASPTGIISSPASPGTWKLALPPPNQLVRRPSESAVSLSNFEHVTMPSVLAHMDPASTSDTELGRHRYDRELEPIAQSPPPGKVTKGRSTRQKLAPLVLAGGDQAAGAGAHPRRPSEASPSSADSAQSPGSDSPRLRHNGQRDHSPVSPASPVSQRSVSRTQYHIAKTPTVLAKSIDFKLPNESPAAAVVRVITASSAASMEVTHDRQMSGLNAHHHDRGGGRNHHHHHHHHHGHHKNSQARVVPKKATPWSRLLSTKGGLILSRLSLTADLFRRRARARDSTLPSEVDGMIHPFTLAFIPPSEETDSPEMGGMDAVDRPDLETAFRADYFQRFRETNQRSLLIIAFAMLALGIYDTIQFVSTISTEDMLVTWALRVVACGACLALSALARSSHYSASRLQRLTFLVLATVGVLWTQIFITLNVYKGVYGVGVILMLLSLSSVAFGLRFVTVAATLFTVLVYYSIAGLALDGAFPFVMFFLLGGSALYAHTAYFFEYYVRRDFIRLRKRADEERRSSTLLESMLPEAVIEEIRKDQPVAHEVAFASVLFCDVVSFTTLAARIAPEDLVAMLNVIFSTFDALSTVHNVYKVETIGDAYLACSGIVNPVQNHTHNLADFALDMQEAARSFRTPDGLPINVRVGIHTGPVIAGVVGKKMPRYHLFGETYTIAETFEKHGMPSKVVISGATREALGDHFDTQELEPIPAGGATMRRYLLLGRAYTAEQQQQLVAQMHMQELIDEQLSHAGTPRALSSGAAEMASLSTPVPVGMPGNSSALGVRPPSEPNGHVLRSITVQPLQLMRIHSAPTESDRYDVVSALKPPDAPSASSTIAAAPTGESSAGPTLATPVRSPAFSGPARPRLQVVSAKTVEPSTAGQMTADATAPAKRSPPSVSQRPVVSLEAPIEAVLAGQGHAVTGADGVIKSLFQPHAPGAPQRPSVIMRSPMVEPPELDPEQA